MLRIVVQHLDAKTVGILQEKNKHEYFKGAWDLLRGHLTVSQWQGAEKLPRRAALVGLLWGITLNLCVVGAKSYLHGADFRYK